MKRNYMKRNCKNKNDFIGKFIYAYKDNKIIHGKIVNVIFDNYCFEVEEDNIYETKTICSMTHIYDIRETKNYDIFDFRCTIFSYSPIGEYKNTQENIDMLRVIGNIDIIESMTKEYILAFNRISRFIEV